MTCFRTRRSPGFGPKPDAAVLLDYLRVYLPLHNYDASVGVAVKGKTLNKGSLASLLIPLPDVQEQQRIVDIVGTAEKAEAAREHHSAAQALFDAQLAAFIIESADAPTRPLGELAEVASGISWTKADEIGPGPGTIGVMGVSNVQRDHVHTRECVHLPAFTGAREEDPGPHASDDPDERQPRAGSATSIALLLPRSGTRSADS